MWTIHKFKLDKFTGTTKIQIPASAQILCFQQQAGIPTIWVYLDNADSTVTRQFTRYGTGWDNEPSPYHSKYIGTVQDNLFVWHLFENLRG